MHGSGFGACELKASDRESREIFKPMVSAMAMLRMGLQPSEL
jgi:hypothetical protein